MEGTQMLKVSRESATQGGDFGPVVDRSDRVEDYTVGFTSFAENIDATPLMKGLPGEQCHSPHWGYVFTGSMTFRFPDRDEVFEAGDAFYTPPGHVQVATAPGTEILMFSPTDALRETDAAIKRNMQEMQAR
jgi:hypothetical protein